jgi:hypothetical protein
MKEISLHLLDLVENAVAAGARRVEIMVEEDPEGDRLRLRVTDDGRGMPAEILRSASDPFTTSRTTRSVGMGLALLGSAAEQAGGALAVSSTVGKGTEVRAEFQLSHIDCAPLGRLDETLAAVAVLHPELDLRYRHRGPTGTYCVDLLSVTPHDSTHATAREVKRLVRAGLQRIGSSAW